MKLTSTDLQIYNRADFQITPSEEFNNDKWNWLNYSLTYKLFQYFKQMQLTLSSINANVTEIEVTNITYNGQLQFIANIIAIVNAPYSYNAEVLSIELKVANDIKVSCTTIESYEKEKLEEFIKAIHKFSI